MAANIAYWAKGKIFHPFNKSMSLYCGGLEKWKKRETSLKAITLNTFVAIAMRCSSWWAIIALMLLKSLVAVTTACIFSFSKWHFCFLPCACRSNLCFWCAKYSRVSACTGGGECPTALLGYAGTSLLISVSSFVCHIWLLIITWSVGTSLESWRRDFVPVSVHCRSAEFVPISANWGVLYLVLSLTCYNTSLINSAF